MKRLLYIFCILIYCGCNGKKDLHDFTSLLRTNKETLVKKYGESKQQRTLDDNLSSLSYAGNFAGLKGTWSYYIRNADNVIYSIEFITKDAHQEEGLAALTKIFGEPLSLADMLAEVPEGDEAGMIRNFMLTDYTAGKLRVWNSTKHKATVILGVYAAQAAEEMSIVCVDATTSQLPKTNADN